MIEIKAPQLPESVSEGILARWCKQPGEAVKRDEVIAELETDKVILEIPAPQDGVLNELICQEEDTVVSEQLLAYIVPQSAAAVEAPAAAPAEAAAPASAPVMPAASQEGLRQGISMDQVTGSGNGGRVLKEDVVRAAEAQKAPVQTPEPVVTKAPATPIISGSREERREPMSRLRARVAERLLESQRENAILTTFNEVNMQPVMDLRKRWKDDFAAKHDVKLGFMSFFVKAATSALREFPILNASVDGKDIIWHDYCDIGIAVSSPRGLVVPALRNAEQMSIKEIESQIAEYAIQARNGKLPLEALQGGTFSITNGGTFGSMMSTPIINPPQSAILGMHAITPRAVVEDGNIVIRPMMYLALSYDHRIIDGQEAVQALVHIRRLLESPERFLLDI